MTEEELEAAAAARIASEPPPRLTPRQLAELARIVEESLTRGRPD